MLFDPFELDTSVTPGRIREALRQQEFTRAILMAFRLNERKLTQEALEAVPPDESEPGVQRGQGVTIVLLI
jgi:periodic tryptophan protein 2